ncbi:hypothetical protein [Candidatus Sulfurimonas baltica]|uniref:Uncharacterized protein n=1 Tax=Candidatus Sulfurimonas baltica TaxID=2740404 RepID=A0A7S7LTA4_9BACT|nr:hypothetical protein [Candidatus Sulfurimonas baltica]QOY50917.1 hypothetical protein HUE88_07110 [Candidatus Sulfurimonas baltica]
MQTYSNDKNIKESNRLIRKAKKSKVPLSKSQAEFIQNTRTTSFLDAIFSMPVRD